MQKRAASSTCLPDEERQTIPARLGIAPQSNLRHRCNDLVCSAKATRTRIRFRSPSDSLICFPSLRGKGTGATVTTVRDFTKIVPVSWLLQRFRSRRFDLEPYNEPRRKTARIPLIRVIEKIDKPVDILRRWLLANATHVADSVYDRGGKLSDLVRSDETPARQ